MPTTTLDTSDAAELAELAEMLTLIGDWLSSSQKQTLAASLATFVGHTAYDVETLRADLHRFTPARQRRRGTTVRTRTR